MLETDTHIIAVMEIVNGDIECYKDWIRTQHLEKEVFSQLIDAYRHVLRCGYYHCNLSTETVLLQLQANSDNPSSTVIVIKLSGFEQAIPISTSRSISADGACKGNTSFMAPEVAFSGCVDNQCFEDSYRPGQADIWSLGIILFCLLVGETPFDSANSSDPFFLAFQDDGFDSIRPSLIEANASPDSIGMIVTAC